MFWRSAARPGCVTRLRCWSLAVCSGTPTCPQCPLVTSRFFSVSAPRTRSPTHEGVKPPVKRWALAASPFGTVRAQLGCSISVRPLDLHAYPEADRVFVAVRGPDSEQEVGLDHLRVHYDDQSKELLISAKGVKSSVSIDLTAPIKSSECPAVSDQVTEMDIWSRSFPSTGQHHFLKQLTGYCLMTFGLLFSDLFITTQGKGHVQVENMECDICTVQTEQGSCFLHSVKVVAT